METRTEVPEIPSTEGEPPGYPPARAPRRRRLASIANVKTALADAIRDLEAAEVGPPAKARTLIYGYSTLASVIESERITGLEARLAALEARLAAPAGGKP